MFDYHTINRPVGYPKPPDNVFCTGCSKITDTHYVVNTKLVENCLCIKMFCHGDNLYDGWCYNCSMLTRE